MGWFWRFLVCFKLSQDKYPGVVWAGFHRVAKSLINLIGLGWSHGLNGLHSFRSSLRGSLWIPLWLSHKPTFSTHVISLESLQVHKNITHP